ncbi:MAG: penicillin-binding protein 1B, partial [Pseudomonadota bacterium]
MTKPKKRRSRRRVPTKPNRSWKRWLLLGLAGLCLGAALYVIYLDHIVQIRFDGRRWTVPAQVYARPMQLAVGVLISPTRLTLELDGLGYRRVKHPDQPGTYSSYQGRFLVRSRDFRFPGEQRPSEYLEIRISKDRLVSLKQAARGVRIEKIQLEPRLIGSLHPAHSEDRVLLRRSELQEGLVQALIAVEDRNFFQHHGVDPAAILRAVWANLRAVGVVQGGSTLTQQLVKNFFLTPQRSLWRKLNEALMALILEARFSKDEILEAYANEIYLGQDGGRAIHGFGLASRFYFNRPLKELDLPKMALLVTLVRGPSAYDPRRHPERARKRRALVLQIMQEQGLISAELASQAAAAPLGIQQGVNRSSGTPAYMDLVRRQLRRDYQESDLNSEGLRIFTTLDPWSQSQAEKALSSQLDRLEKSRRLDSRTLQGAVVVVDAWTGDVTALVGDRNPRYAGFNRALDALRPVGSLIKPAVYLAALSRPEKYHLLSELQDTPIHIRGADGQVWSPGNYDRTSHGPVPLQSALANSYNQATVRLGMSVGLPAVLAQLESLGIRRPIQAFPSLLLGAVSMSPLEMTQMYQTLATGGYQATLKAIRQVTDSSGRVLSRYPVSVRQTLDPNAAYLLNHALQEVVRNGTAKSLSRSLPGGVNVAGKTGTTDDLRDSWFAGFDLRHVAVVWVGRDDNEPIGLTGSSGAMQVWSGLMRSLGVSSQDKSPPAGVEVVEIDPLSGLRGAGCKETQAIPFIKGHGPSR